MSGLGITPWSADEWQQYETALNAAGWYIDHCAHCDRSARHPSCVILPIPERVQLPIPILDERAERRTA